MQSYLDCIPCFLRQALGAMRMVSSDEHMMQGVLRRVMQAAMELDMSNSPPVMGQIIHRIIREETGARDPYEEIKAKATSTALRVIDNIRSQILAAEKPLHAALRFSIAGNIMDYALFSRWSSSQLAESIESALQRPLDEPTLAALEDRLARADTVLLLADNAGETVFDRLLLEQLPCPRRIYAVKGAPVINDATMEDALAAGVDSAAELISNGTDAPGTLLDQCSPDFLRVFEKADLVMAKGQGNYESLRDETREIFFLTQIKCPIIARDLDGAVGDWVLCSNSQASSGAV